MKKTALILFPIILLAVLAVFFVPRPHSRFKAAKEGVVTVTFLTENTCGLPGIKPEIGLSVLIEKDGKQYLYDTGRTDTAVRNASVLGKDLRRTEKIFLSHGHSDHTGGLENVLKAIGHPVEIVCHPEALAKKVRIMNGKQILVGLPFTQEYLEKKYKVEFSFHKDFEEVAEGIWLTGEIPFTNTYEDIPADSKENVEGTIVNDNVPDDNALVLDSKNGLIVIMGCGHHGMVNTVGYVRKTLKKKKIYAVMGGTHLAVADQREKDIVKAHLHELFPRGQEGIFAPNHCTGPEMEAQLKAECPGIYRDAHAGSSFEF